MKMNENNIMETLKRNKVYGADKQKLLEIHYITNQKSSNADHF